MEKLLSEPRKRAKYELSELTDLVWFVEMRSRHGSDGGGGWKPQRVWCGVNSIAGFLGGPNGFFFFRALGVEGDKDGFNGRGV